MADKLLQPRIVRMPDFAPGVWLNSPGPLTKEALRGQVLLIDFWDYTCINCLRTLPYLQKWRQRYQDKGLTIIGVHAPEFKFGRLRKEVETAVSRLQIRYPILLDNGYQTWSRFANKAWPTKYLVDKGGYIRFQRQGEGFYQKTEQAIQRLLRQRMPGLSLPDILPPLRPEDEPGAVCYRPTPELYAGYQGGGLFGGGLGNPSGYLPDKPIFYDLPETEERAPGQFYLEGVWRAWPEALAYAGQQGGRVVLPYEAATVNGVLAPSADPVEVSLALRPSAATPLITVQQDGRFLAPHNAGKDIEFDENGRSLVRVTQARMYELVRHPNFKARELTLTFQANGLALYAFTFTGCVATDGHPGDEDTYRVR